jgi:hypothetical protein
VVKQRRRKDIPLTGQRRGSSAQAGDFQGNDEMIDTRTGEVGADASATSVAVCSQALIEQRRAVEHDHKRAAKKNTKKEKSPPRDRRARQRQREQGKQARRAQQRARAERRAAQP